jgi:hypothetical protein
MNVNYEAPYCVMFSTLLLLSLVNINLGTLPVGKGKANPVTGRGGP